MTRAMPETTSGDPPATASIAPARLAHKQVQETWAQWCHDRLTPHWQVCTVFLPTCPQAKVKYVNVVHVDFIWSSMIRTQMLNCNPPPWETQSWQETVCFCKQQTGINYWNGSSAANSSYTALLLLLVHIWHRLCWITHCYPTLVQ